MLENDDNLDSDRGTVTQSGSSEGVQGFGGRFGLRMVECVPFEGFGGATTDRAILPFSNHHFC